VPSIPRKIHNRQEELLNPYTNPNLDSDLSETIGKLGKKIGGMKLNKVKLIN
jgi:hypothetical protein